MLRRRQPLARHASLALVPICVVALGVWHDQVSARQLTQSVTASATFGARTSLHVSSAESSAGSSAGSTNGSASVLRFHVTDALTPAEVSVDFTAGARTRANGDVRLILQLANPATMPSGATRTALTIAGGTAGTVPGGVAADGSMVAARWSGSGRRSGRVRFRLQAAPGHYDIPVNFSLDIS